MQPRMLKNALSQEEIFTLLESERVGHLATIGADGPYVIPVNYVLIDGKIYVHGRKAGGKKLDNIKADDRVCFEVEKVEGYATGQGPCDTETIFKSAIGRGRARVLEDGHPRIEAALLQFSRVYVQTIENPVIPPSRLEKTAVIEITIDEWTGKYGK